MLEAIRERGFEAIESPGAAPDPAKRMPLKPYDPVDEERALREWYAGSLASRRADALLDIAQEGRMELIIRDEADFGAPIAAERLRIPRAHRLVIAAAALPLQGIRARRPAKPRAQAR